MKDHIQEIFNSGLSLSLDGEKLKVAGTSETVETFRPLLKQYRNEIITALQAASLNANKHGELIHPNDVENATEGGYKQLFHALPCSDDDRGVLADAVVQIGRLQADQPGMEEELIKAFNTVEAAEFAGDQESFDFALLVLRAALDRGG